MCVYLSLWSGRPCLVEGELEGVQTAQVILWPLPWYLDTQKYPECVLETWALILSVSFWTSDLHLLRDPDTVNELSHSAPQWTQREECRQQGEILRVRLWGRSVLIIRWREIPKFFLVGAVTRAGGTRCQTSGCARIRKGQSELSSFIRKGVYMIYPSI